METTAVSERTSFRRVALWVTLAYVAIAVALTFITDWADKAPLMDAGTALPNDLPPLLDNWYRYDGGWYVTIANGPYFYSPGEQSNVAFFPVYPLLGRFVGGLVGSNFLGLWLVAVLGGLASCLLFARWVWDRLPAGPATWSIVAFMLYPYAFFLYGQMYAESVFLAFAIAAFLALERNWYLVAGLFGALCTACRPVGVAVAAALLIRMLEKRAERRRDNPPTFTRDGLRVRDDRPGFRDVVTSWRGRWSEWLVLVSGLGLAAWMAYQWVQFGTPLAFVEVESAPGWDQGQGPKTWFKFRFISELIHGHWKTVASNGLQGAFVIAGLFFARRVKRLFGWGYASYLFIVLFIPLVGTKDFYGGGRYVLVAFPFFAALGDFLAHAKRRWLSRVYVAGSGVGLVTGAILFTKGLPLS